MLVLTLIGLPVIFGFLVLILPRGAPSSFALIAGSLAQAGLALVFVALGGGGAQPLIAIPWEREGILGLELLLAAFFAVSAVRSRRLLPLLLALTQAAIALIGETWTEGIEARSTWSYDGLAALMVLVIGLVGGLIVLYSAGYMRRFHEEHPEIKDRRRSFGAIFLIFLGAMYGLVLANDLRLLLLFWEVTTWASFVLIGYNRDQISVRNSFLALDLNLLGGIAFALGNLILAATTGSLELDGLGAASPAVIAIPLACIALAGLVKSAQLPFTPWLLGAMVAPTPVSALLHSSTMVKAGVFLIIRLSPAIAGTFIGDMVALVGLLTFVTGAFMAISQRNAKRVLALSTVSNLGLIVLAAGIGTPQLLWAAFFLVLFHAVAKALLFLGVGTASLGTGSLDIEDMGGLAVTMPRLALLLTIGIAGMFIAPFGMLVSKWTAMEAFIDFDSPLGLAMLTGLAWGSATTVFFWTKWLGTLLRVPDPGAPRGALETGTTRTESLSETLLAAAALLCFGGFALVSSFLAEPWLASAGRAWSPGSANVSTTLLMVGLAVLLPGVLILLARRNTKALSGAYLSGRPAGAGLTYKGSAGVEKTVALRSMYLEGLLGEKRLLPIAIALGILLIIVMFGTVIA